MQQAEILLWRLTNLVRPVPVTLYWSNRQIVELLGLDERRAYKELIKTAREVKSELANPPASEWQTLEPDVVTLETIRAQERFQSAYDRRARVLERSSAVLSAASLLLAAVALFYQTATPIPAGGNEEKLGAFAWWPLRVYYPSLVCSATFLTLVVLRCLHQLVASEVFVPSSELAKSGESVQDIQIRRGAELELAARGNDNEATIRSNSLNVAVRQCRYAAELLAVAAIANIVARTYDDVVAILTGLLTPIEERGAGSFILVLIWALSFLLFVRIYRLINADLYATEEAKSEST